LPSVGKIFPCLSFSGIIKYLKATEENIADVEASFVMMGKLKMNK